jgi:hypothetical protein
MTDVFEFRTGKFTPLSNDVLAKFNDEQLGAYTDLKSAVAQLDAANLDAESAIAVNRAAVAALHEAEVIERKRPRYTRLDEHRKAIAQWQEDHR